ncbi:hypothetical protein EJA72_09205, partial [Pseudomonas sp. PB120]|nr:hypothetical protein [Pseudomonas sp. PB120]
MPSLRHCSVGPPPSAIHAGLPTAQCLRSAIVVNGAPRSKAKRGGLKADLAFFGCARFKNVGASLLAMDVNDNAP